MRQPLILASTSPYRCQLLKRLQISFEVVAPEVLETPLPMEGPVALVRRLSEAKARSVGRLFPGSLVIGSDQVAVLDDRIIGKPLTEAGAVGQLMDASGREVIFLTGLCCFREADFLQVGVMSTKVFFRVLDEEKIRRYVAREQPLDCAGSFKSEGLGITLFERIEGDDPTALMGLPLMALTRMLEDAGVEI